MRMLHVLAVLALALPQDSETAAASKVTESPLPAGAFRVLQKESVDQTSTLLKAIYKDITFGAIEVLLWPGDYSGDKGAGLRKQSTKLLEKAGYACREEASEQKIEGREVFVCSAERPKRRVFGVWILSNEAALLTWGRSEAAAAAPAEAAIGNVLYTIPKGWKAEVASDGVTLTPTDLLPEEKLFVLILPGREFKGDLGESAEALWAETCKTFQVDGGKLGQKQEVYTTLKGWKYFRTANEVRPSSGRLQMNATFIHVGDRLERVVALGNFIPGTFDENPLYLPKYADDMIRLIYGLKFKNYQEPELREGSLKGEGIVGVWGGIGMGFTAFSGRMEYQAYTAAFYTNGQVFFSAKLQTFLFEGMSPILAREVTPRWWGTYAFDKGSGTIKMIYGDIPMELKDDHLVLTTNRTPHKYVRLPAVDGTRLDGTWAFSEWNGKIPKITFSPDGRFSDQGALRVLEHSLYKRRSTTEKPGEGTYEVKNWTILFHYADGREFTAAFLGLTYKPGDQKPAELTLGFNHDTLKRQ